MENELTEKYGEMDKKLPIINELLQLGRQFPDRWQAFVSNNPAAAMSGSEAAMNRPIGELEGILAGFKGFLDANPPDSVNDTSEQQSIMVAPNNPTLYDLGEQE